MKKAILAVAAAAIITAGTLAAPTTADAKGGRKALAIGAGILGAAIIGNAIVNGTPRGGYVYYEGYNAPSPYACRHGYWARQRLYDRYGNFVGWSKPHFVCR